jgi:hypothetical protein
LFAMPGSLHERELIEGVFSGLMGQLAGEPPSLRAVPSARDPVEAPVSGWDEAGEEGELPTAPRSAASPLGRPPPEGAVPWWVIADARHVARLRRLLDGPPRAADD